MRVYKHDLKDFLGEISRVVYGKSPEEIEELKKKDICVNCGEFALPRCYSEAGRKEFVISGTCEICFDNMFKEI